MANFLFNAAAARRNNGTFNWTLSKTVLLFGAGYTPDPTDVQVADLGVAPLASTLLTGLSIGPDGSAKSYNPVFTQLAGAVPIRFAVIVETNATVSASLLVAYYDGFAPFTPNGDDWALLPDARGWFR